MLFLSDHLLLPINSFTCPLTLTALTLSHSTLEYSVNLITVEFESPANPCTHCKEPCTVYTLKKTAFTLKRARYKLQEPCIYTRV